jgi:hypothetical protein
MSIAEPLKDESVALDNDPDGWVVNRLQDARRQVMHHGARGDAAAAARWKRVEKCLDYALAMFMSTAKMPDLPERSIADFAQSVLREVATTADYAPARIEAVRLLLELDIAKGESS